MPKDDIKALYDQARDHLRAAPRPHEQTRVDGVLGPAPGDTPAPVARRPLPRAESAEPFPPHELESDPFTSAPDSAAPASSGFDEREAPTKALPGRRRKPPPVAVSSESSYPHYAPGGALPGVTPSMIAQAERMPLGRLLIVIAASATGLVSVIAALGVAVVNIITALHPPSNTEVMTRLGAVETRVNGGFGLPLETQTRRAEDEKLREELEKIQKAQKKLEGLAVPIKVQPKTRHGTEAP